MRVLGALLLAAALAGCGGGDKQLDPVETFKVLVRAAAEDDLDELTPRLTSASRDRAGDLLRRLKPYAGGYRFIVTEPADRWALIVVANPSTTRAAAFVMKEEEGEWRTELRDAVRIRPIGPRPGSSQQLVAQLAAAVVADARLGPTGLWLDGFAVDVRAGASGDGRRATIFANLPEPVAAGRHVVTAFATTGPSANAVAWTFGVSRKR